jgi:predicted nucleic acid-binding protein
VITYLDSSVVLRLVLGQPDRLAEWPEIERGVASGLVEVECLRTIDRLRHLANLADEEIARRREAVFRLLEALEIVEPTATVLRRAAQPLPTPLGTLDAIHLATASLWRETRGLELTVATHDRALAMAARATGFRIIGLFPAGSGPGP